MIHLISISADVNKVPNEKQLPGGDGNVPPPPGEDYPTVGDVRMLHDISPKRYHVEYENYQPEDNDTIFIFGEEGVYCKVTDNVLTFPKHAEFHDIQEVKFRYLFSIDNERYFMPDIWSVVNIIVPEGYVVQDAGISRIAGPKHLAFASITARELYEWYSARKFCGRCGNETIHAEAERACVCPGCGLVEYPKISPVVIVAVTNGENLLVTRYKDRPYRRYALVAGFGEIGESLEDTVRREVYEETGVRVKNPRYYKSQPWGFSSSLLSGFICELDGDPDITVDDKELSEALWLPRGEIPPADSDVALTAEMMEMFRLGKI